MSNSEYDLPTCNAQDLHDLVRAMLGEEKGKLWWDAPNPQFGNLIPKDIWFSHRKQRLKDFVLQQAVAMIEQDRAKDE